MPPPPVEPGQPRAPRRTTRRYRRLAPDVLPATECLKDVVARVLPYWYDAIVPELRAGLVVLVVAHGNSLRALVKHLEDISDDDIAELNIPTGVPRRYALDDDLRRGRTPPTSAMPRPSPRRPRRRRAGRRVAAVAARRRAAAVTVSHQVRGLNAQSDVPR